MKKNPNISSLSHADCCGCRACGDTCPVSCISFCKDDEGFIYPVVDETVCIHCGKCVKTCPEFNPVYNDTPIDVSAAFASSYRARQAGSSGGLFGVLASQIIAKGGKVWGASFDKNFQLKHKSASTHDELIPLLRSKYLQSDASGCFKQIAEDLNQGITTLFCGTPCQCNALRNYVKEYPNLYLVDLICHGVPSQDLFDKSISWLEEKHHCKITKFEFRSKYRGALHPHAFSYICEKNGNRNTINGLHYQFPFYFGFQKYITLRPSCYSCKWARSERSGDITLGDFWGIEKYDHNLNPKSGISEVIANTERGRILLNEIVETGSIWIESFPFSQVVGENGCLHGPTKLKPERKKFFADLRDYPFDRVVKEHLTANRQWIFDLYYAMPKTLRAVIRNIMDKRMRYE